MLTGARLLVAAAIVPWVAGCSYTSAYVPPADGRARVVWRDDNVVAQLPRPASPDCAGELWLAGTGQEVIFVPGGLWWWSPAVVEVERDRGRPGGSVTGAPGAGSRFGHGAPTVAGGVRGGGGGGGKGGGGGGGGGGSGWAVVAVVALLAIPVLTISLAATRPENEPRAAEAADRVNAYNDLVRVGDPACAEVGP